MRFGGREGATGFPGGNFGWIGFRMKWLPYENTESVDVRQRGVSGSC